MNTLFWALLIIACCIVLAALVYIYAELGKAALECILECNLPDRWKYPIRVIVFILNPLFWSLFIVVCILVLIGYVIHFVFYDCFYEMTIVLKRNYKEIKELILK